MPPSLAFDFFERVILSSDKVSFLRTLVNSTPPTVETDWLDFKTEPTNPQTWDKQIREMWCEALTGFANNQGGVLVWGIVARKTQVNGLDIDAACGERLVNNPLTLKSRLAELQRGATDPPIANVRIEAIELAHAPRTGFVVCYIPEGPFKPYRTNEGRNSQFYLRAGDNFVTMSRPMIQSLFYPRSQARFTISARLSWEYDHNSREFELPATMSLEVEIKNTGTATAKNVLVEFKHAIKPGNGVKTTPFRPYLGWALEGFFGKFGPLHPNMPPSKVFGWQWTVPTASLPRTDFRTFPNCPNPTFTLHVYCDDQEPQSFQIGYDMQHLENEGEPYVVNATPLDQMTER